MEGLGNRLFELLPRQRAELYIRRIEDEISRFAQFNRLEYDRASMNVSIVRLAENAGHDSSQYQNYKKGKFIPDQETLNNYREALLLF